LQKVGEAGIEADEAESHASWDGGQKKELLLYPGVHLKHWQRSIRQAQMEINLLLDGDTTLVAHPHLVFQTQPHHTEHTPGKTRSKRKTSFCLKMTAKCLSVALRSDEGLCLLECRLTRFSGAFANKAGKEWSAIIGAVEIGTGARSRTGFSRKILSHRACAETGDAAAASACAADSPQPFFQASFSVEEGIAQMRARMQAMDVCFDDAFVNSLLAVKHRASSAWETSKIKWTWSSNERSMSQDACYSIANKVKAQRAQSATAHVTLCGARHLPNVDGMWGSCDAFVELVYKDKIHVSTVKKNSLNPEWKPEEKFEFDLLSGELADIRIQLVNSTINRALRQPL
jgi:hypothetical protein